jgi:Putative beta-barrel porin 2
LTSTDRSNSASALSSADLSLRGIEVGGRYDPGAILNGELVIAKRTISFPNFQTTDSLGQPLLNAVDNGYSATQLIARANYQPTGQSSLSGNIGFSSSSFNSLKQRDNSGLLFGLTYRYLYSDALTFGARLSKDIVGEQLSFSSPVQSTRFGFDASWRMTGRTTLSGAVLTTNRKFNSDAGVVLSNNPLTSDRLQSASLNGRYELLRTVFLNASLLRASRNASVSNFSYAGTTAMLGIAVSLD